MPRTLRGCQPSAKRGGMAATLTLVTRTIKMRENYNINDLVGEREKLSSLVDYLSSNLEGVDTAFIKDLLIQQKEQVSIKLKDIDDILSCLGIPIYLNDVATTFNRMGQEINKLQEPDALMAYIKKHTPSRFIQYLNNIEKQQNGKIGAISGKWIGTFKSSSGYYPGEFCFALNQVGTKVVGVGVLLNSMYAQTFIKGITDGDEITVEVHSEETPIISYFNGVIQHSGDMTNIDGTYSVANGFDDGLIKSTIEKKVSPFRSKSSQLIIVEKIRNRIANSNLNGLFEDFQNLEDSILTFYTNEILLHKNRLDRLNQTKRLNLISFSEAQLEESKIIYDVLTMVSDIESKIKISNYD